MKIQTKYLTIKLAVISVLFSVDITGKEIYQEIVGATWIDEGNLTDSLKIGQGMFSNSFSTAKYFS